MTSSVLTGLEVAGLTAAQYLVNVIPQGNIGGIAIRATLQEEYSDSIELTDNPVQAGSQVTDHSFRRPSALLMRCGWSNSDPQAALNSLVNTVSSLLGAGSSTLVGGVQGSTPSVSDYVSGIYFQLLRLHQARNPLTIISTLRKYTNMVITDLTVTRDEKTSQALMCTARMREVILVNAVSVTLPVAANMANPASTAGASGVVTTPLVETAQTEFTGAYNPALPPGATDADDINLLP